jgi:virginiamycin B lyase
LRFRPPGAGLLGITTGPDGNIWFVEASANKIGRLALATLTFTEFVVPASAGVQQIATGSDGNLWFTELSRGKIGRITPAEW